MELRTGGAMLRISFLTDSLVVSLSYLDSLVQAEGTGVPIGRVDQ